MKQDYGSKCGRWGYTRDQRKEQFECAIDLWDLRRKKGLRQRQVASRMTALSGKRRFCITDVCHMEHAIGLTANKIELFIKACEME